MVIPTKEDYMVELEDVIQQTQAPIIHMPGCVIEFSGCWETVDMDVSYRVVVFYYDGETTAILGELIILLNGWTYLAEELREAGYKIPDAEPSATMVMGKAGEDMLDSGKLDRVEFEEIINNYSKAVLELLAMADEEL